MSATAFIRVPLPVALTGLLPGIAADRPYVVTDTGQQKCYGAAGGIISPPLANEGPHGQDAQYQGPQMMFRDNGDGTVSDLNTGLMWQKTPDLEDKSTFAEAKRGALECRLGGHSDWRLPNAKELQSIVDYTRAPDAINPERRRAAIDPIFEVAAIESYFCTGTTHLEAPGQLFGGQAVYIAFGRAMGWMGPPGRREKEFINVHGAGAQRSDPKVGDPAQFPRGRGPQGG